MDENVSTISQQVLDSLREEIQHVRDELHKVIIGQDETIDFLLVALFTGGHVLLEGVPGIAKTLLARMLAKTVSVNFLRIQFTPDLMPSDVIGTMIFNPKTSEFNFRPGPLFASVVLIDEINRSPAKTQSALFEAMEERRVTIDGITHLLPQPFFVIATQNPIEQEGTYKLPEAQLDRFIYKLNMQYPKPEEELLILQRFKEDFQHKAEQTVQPVLNATDLTTISSVIEQVYLKDELITYIANITISTRNHGDLYLGASPRASLAILKTAKALAVLNGRSFVIPEDIQSSAYPVLNHRILLTPERELEGVTAEQVIRGIIEKLEIPR